MAHTQKLMKLAQTKSHSGEIVYIVALKMVVKFNERLYYLLYIQLERLAQQSLFSQT